MRNGVILIIIPFQFAVDRFLVLESLWQIENQISFGGAAPLMDGRLRVWHWRLPILIADFE